LNHQWAVISTCGYQLKFAFENVGKIMYVEHSEASVVLLVIWAQKARTHKEHLARLAERLLAAYVDSAIVWRLKKDAYVFVTDPSTSVWG
jgi:hypothetical protein